MNKKYLLLALPILLLSCSKQESSKSNLTINEFFQQLFCFERYEVSSSSEAYLVDGDSFKDVNNNTTYYKYVFKEKYQKYTDVVIDNNYSVIESISDRYEYLTSLVHFFDNFTSTGDDKYVLVDGKEENYQYLFAKEIQDITIDYKNEVLTYSFVFTDGNYDLSFKLSDECISPFGTHFQSESTFYKDHASSFDKVMNKIEGAEDFVLILTSPSCSHCKDAERLYETFFYEYEGLDMVSLDISKLNSKQSGQLIGTFFDTYKNEDISMKHENYEEYPSNSFLTPTAIRYSNNVSKYVLLGFSIEDGDVFYKLAFN